jgi:hypothetical protein
VRTHFSLARAARNTLATGLSCRSSWDLAHKHLTDVIGVGGQKSEKSQRGEPSARLLLRRVGHAFRRY